MDEISQRLKYIFEFNIDTIGDRTTQNKHMASVI